MARPKNFSEAEWEKLQMLFNEGDWPTLKAFADELGLSYYTVRHKLKAALKAEFQQEAVALAREMVKKRRASELALLIERHLNLTDYVKRGVIQALGEDGAIIPGPENMDEAVKGLRVLLEAIRIERTIHGEPESHQQVSGSGPGGSLPIMAIVARANDLAERHPEILDLLGQEGLEGDDGGD